MGKRWKKLWLKNKNEAKKNVTEAEATTPEPTAAPETTKETKKKKSWFKSKTD